jgi:DNA-binding NarL/FixJ family response regulator
LDYNNPYIFWNIVIIMAEERRYEGKVVAIADDTEGMRETIVEDLREAFSGIEIIAARDGEDLIKQIEAANRRVDVVITDFSMPFLNGLGVLKKAKELSYHFPIYVASMHTDPAYSRAVMAEGAKGFLDKSDSVTMMKVVRKELDRA